MSRAVYLLVVVLITYVILFFRARGKRIAKEVASLAERSKREAEIVVAKTMAQPTRNPFTPKPDVIDYFTPIIEKLTHLGEDPIMHERVNEGSEEFFKAEKEAAARRAYRSGMPPLLDSEMDVVKDLWPKPGHHAGERTRLPDVGKPADPGDGPLEPESES
jgi:hypothetical protein